MKKHFTHFKGILLAILMMAPVFSGNSQINGMDDFISKLQELRAISQKMGKYYILQNLYPANSKYKNDLQQNVETFNNIIVELIDQAPSEELEMEMQKLNLTWMYVGKILKTKYDRAAAAKVLDKLEYLQQEADKISHLAVDLTKKNYARIVQTAAESRVMLQRMILYFIAKRAKVLNPHIEERFNESVRKLKEDIRTLENWQGNDESTLMLLEMIKNKLKTLGKNISIDSKVSPLTADMVVEGMDNDLQLLMKVIKEKIQ